MRSYTALSTFTECPWQYALKYVHGLKDDPAVWNVGGTAFHQCAEWILNGDLDLDSLTDEGIANGWDDAWREAYLEVMERNPDANPDIATWRAANQGREGLAWWHKNGPEMVSRFVEWKRTVGRDMTPIEGGIENRFEVEIWGVPVVAIPDALVYDEFGQLNILDWKSGRRPPKGSLQLGVYRAAVLHGWGLDAVWGHFYLTRKASLVPYDLTTWNPDEIGRMFYDFDTRAKAEQFTPTPGDHCKFCPATREHCSFSPKEPA